ncbi:hypothetical protein M3P05_02560 [Sansalvadorimonas sp. 2012CJ34-2]|uniref:IraD/Gp25-like domain-containing protein n=1 Tax=Parendozoicomonas callyspongiae TaxID=2942213 RepID=A0ABT0PBS0_9GAMM|nr:hypothetical protein [Sansalvadorimonas sp. 2012CJ34-2]MCL6268832.1 hypothetical protein [Sansalvadorimonas sp. 2012CJ34-2]
MIELFTEPKRPELEHVKACVINSLSALLSTRAPVVSASKASSIPLLGYGVPCWQYPTCDLEEIGEELTRRIEHHIHKLEKVVVKPLSLSAKRGVGFVVEGWIYVNRDYVHIRHII